MLAFSRYLLLVGFILACVNAWAQGTIERTTWFEGTLPRIKQRYWVKADTPTILHGSFEQFYPTGDLRMKGNYLNGKQNDIWEFYYENGAPKSKGTYYNGIKNGQWQFYYEKGSLQSQGKLEQGKKNGPWSNYYENGNPKSKGSYKNDQPTGNWEYFYEDGSLKAKATYKQNIGHYTEYHPSGKKKMFGKLVNGVSDSIWSHYDISGFLAEQGPEVNGKRHGTWKVFYPDGKLSASGNYSEGIKIGEWQYYHPEGGLFMKGLMENDLQNGAWEIYDPQGNPTGEAMFEMGNGTFFDHYKSGKIKTVGYFRNGLYDSAWYYYYESGELMGQCFYENGYGMHMGYYPTGELKSTGLMRNGQRAGEYKLYNRKGQLVGIYHPSMTIPINAETRKIVIYNGKLRTDSINQGMPDLIRNRSKLHYFDRAPGDKNYVFFSTNPFMPIFYQIPVGLAFVRRERIGYEFTFTLSRKPFINTQPPEHGNIHYQGFTFDIKQNFYHREKRYGSPYFGHLLRVGNINYQTNTVDSVGRFTETIAENSAIRLGYYLTGGLRYMHEVTRKRTITIEAFGAIGLDRRYWEQTDNLVLFRDLNRIDFHLNYFFGLNFGINLDGE